MRHRKTLKKLGLPKDHRDAQVKNQVASLVLHGKMKTTTNNARVVAARVDRMISSAKKKETREAIRTIARFCAIPEAGKKVFLELLPKYKERTSGFTRITRMGLRKGDSAQIVQIEFI